MDDAGRVLRALLERNDGARRSAVVGLDAQGTYELRHGRVVGTTKGSSMTEISEIEANGMTFRCRVAGDAGEPVVLLHGFPETSHMWSDLMPRLAAAGYRCLAPDQRGYSPDRKSVV